MTDTTQNLVIITLAKGRAAELRQLVKECEDKQTAEMIYREIVQIAKELNNRFLLTKSSKSVKSK